MLALTHQPTLIEGQVLVSHFETSRSQELKGQPVISEGFSHKAVEHRYGFSCIKSPCHEKMRCEILKEALAFTKWSLLWEVSQGSGTANSMNCLSGIKPA